MTITLFETWQSARSLASKDPVLKPRLSQLLDQDSGEISETILRLRETHRDEAVELTQLARAVASRNDIELNGEHKQVQLLLLPVFVSVQPGQGGEPRHLPDLPSGLTLEESVCRVLGLESGSLRAGPFLVSAASMTELSLQEVRELGLHLATMGDYGKLTPALLEQEPDQVSGYSLYLPMVWVGDPEAPLPPTLSEQGLRPAYMEVKMRLEEVLERELSAQCGLPARVTAFKPMSFPMAFSFFRRATFFMDLRSSTREAGGFASGSLEWRFSGDRLVLKLKGAAKELAFEFLFPEESEQSLGELVSQTALALKIVRVFRRG